MRERGENGEDLVFFSSRRRHTRFDCDWSSDVCSSDLERAASQELQHRTRQVRGPMAVRRDHGAPLEDVARGPALEHGASYLRVEQQEIGPIDRKSVV